MTFEIRMGFTDREMSANTEIKQVKVGLSKLRRITLIMAVAFSIAIAGTLLFLWNTGDSDYVFAIHNSAFPQDSSTSHLIQNDKKADASNTIRIVTPNIDWYTLATVVIPFKVIAGEQLNFILDLGDTSSSTNSIVVTIKDNGGQHVLFFFHAPMLTSLLMKSSFNIHFRYLVNIMST